MSLASSMLGDMNQGFTLPITRRGLFCQDDFFQGFQKDYSNAVEDVLGRWGSQSSQADRFASYRRLREKDASEDSLAATISETEDNYVIVVDMSEYASGQITVETVQCSAVIEGKCGSKCYKRQFPLPQNTILDRVTADLSDENILTVTALKKGGKVIPVNTTDSTDNTRVIPVGHTESTDNTAKPAIPCCGNVAASSHASTPKIPVSELAAIEAQIIPTQSQIDLDATYPTPAGKTISMTVEGESTISSASQSVKSVDQSSTERRDSHSRIIPLNIEGGTSSQAQSSTTSSSSGTVTETSKSTSERIIPTTAGGQQTIHTVSSSHQSRVLPIRKRGRFFQDASFESVWKDFEMAIGELVNRRGSNAGLEQGQDRFQTYRNLRTAVQHDDNQAAKVSQENNEHKVVVDVKDFVDGHLDVKAVQGAVVVTGNKGPCSFEKKFSMAGLNQPDKVSAAISTDGVLTIKAPM